MRKTMLGLVLAALMTAGLGSAAWAEPAPAVPYPASAVEAVAAGSDYTYEELLACLTGAGCTEAEALAYAGEPVEAPEGAAVRYSLLRVEDYDGTEDLPVRCLVLAALEYAPGEPVPRSILALRSPMALTGVPPLKARSLPPSTQAGILPASYPGTACRRKIPSGPAPTGSGLMRMGRAMPWAANLSPIPWSGPGRPGKRLLLHR